MVTCPFRHHYSQINGANNGIAPFSAAKVTEYPPNLPVNVYDKLSNFWQSYLKSAI